MVGRHGPNVSYGRFKDTREKERDVLDSAIRVMRSENDVG